MDRKEFIKTCGGACFGAFAFGLLPIGCTPTKMLDAEVEDDFMVIQLSDFINEKEGSDKPIQFLIARNAALSHPIYVHRNNDGEYAALLMRCTHQGTELQAFGDKLQCPAHGSVFDNKGTVANGPAGKNLRTFPVVIENDQLKISLK